MKIKSLIPQFNSFREIFSIDYRSLALFRFSIAALSIYDLLIAWPFLRDFYTDWGILPRSALFSSSSWSYHYVSIYNISGVPAVINILFVVHLIVSLMLLFGFKTRLATFLTWFFTISLIARNPMVVTGGYVMFRLGLFWAIFLPLGARWSIDSALNNVCENPVKLLKKSILSAASFGVILQVLMTYVFAGFHKKGPEWAEDFTGIYYSLHIDQFATTFGKFLLNFPTFLEFNTAFIVYLQRYGVLLFLIPIKNNYFRIIGIILFSFFHIGLNLSMNIGWFQIISIILLTIFIPPQFWDYLIKKLSTDKRKNLKIYYDNDCSFCKRIVFTISTLFLVPGTKVIPGDSVPKINKIIEKENSWVVEDYKGNYLYKFDALMYCFSLSPILFPVKILIRSKDFMKFGNKVYSVIANNRPFLSKSTDFMKFKPINPGTPWPWIVNIIAIISLVYGFYWNIASFDRWAEEENKDNIVVPQSIFWIGPTFQINQYWGLFSPAPMKDDGWLVLSAITKGGEYFDLYTGEELNWEKPKHITKTFPNDRWRKYLMNLWLGQHSDHRVHYGRYMCREWNAKHFGDEQVQSFWMYYMVENTPAPGEEFTEILSAKLHEHACFYPEEE